MDLFGCWAETVALGIVCEHFLSGPSLEVTAAVETVWPLRSLSWALRSWKISIHLVLPRVRLCAHLPVPSRSTWGRLPPRWPGVQDDAAARAWGQRLVSDRVWQQGLWANAPCWARTRALAGQFTSLRLPNVPPWVPPPTWEAIFPHTAIDDTPPFKIVAYSISLLIAKSIHHLPPTHTHMFFQNHHTHTHTPSFIAHLLSGTTFTYNSLTVRSYTISFVYAYASFHLLSLPTTTSSVLTYTWLFHTYFRHIFHTPSLSHAIFRTQLCYTQLFTYNLLTHQSSTTSFVYPSFPVPLELCVSAHWKKLTCGFPASLRWIGQCERGTHICHAFAALDSFTKWLVAACWVAWRPATVARGTEWCVLLISRSFVPLILGHAQRNQMTCLTDFVCLCCMAARTRNEVRPGCVHVKTWIGKLDEENHQARRGEISVDYMSDSPFCSTFAAWAAVLHHQAPKK